MELFDLAKSISEKTEIDTFKLIVYLKTLETATGCEYVLVGDCPEDLKGYKYSDYGSQGEKEFNDAWTAASMNYFLSDHKETHDAYNEVLSETFENFLRFDKAKCLEIEAAMRELGVVILPSDEELNEELRTEWFIKVFHGKDDFVTGRFVKEAKQDLQPRIKSTLRNLERVSML